MLFAAQGVKPTYWGKFVFVIYELNWFDLTLCCMPVVLTCRIAEIKFNSLPIKQILRNTKMCLWQEATNSETWKRHTNHQWQRRSIQSAHFQGGHTRLVIQYWTVQEIWPQSLLLFLSYITVWWPDLIYSCIYLLEHDDVSVPQADFWPFRYKLPSHLCEMS